MCTGMDMPITDYLDEILDEVRDNDNGEVADYIPELAAANPDRLAVSLCTTGGHMYSTGDDDIEFTIQSISKPFAYAIALQELGIAEVTKVVGMEPSGEAFNELSLDKDTNRPMNPMINAGAIAVNQLINGPDSSVEERVDRIVDWFSRLAGRELQVDEEFCQSEIATADRNLSIAYMLRNYGIIQDDAQDAVLSYTRQCSILVTVRDLAMMAATIANGGVNPVTEDHIFDPVVSRHVQAVMASAGMYNGAGRWLAAVGIPAKSGVSGGLIGTLPGQIGMATFSPRLDGQGNSFRGVEIFTILSEVMGMHLMNNTGRVNRAVRNWNSDDGSTIIQLQGAIDFRASENILRGAIQEDLEKRVVLDLDRVSGFNRVGRRIILEGLRRLTMDGHATALFDPDNVLPDPDLGDGTYPEMLTEKPFVTSYEMEVDTP